MSPQKVQLDWFFFTFVFTFQPVTCLFSCLVPGPSSKPSKDENPYVTVLACWVGQEEADTDSSNEDDDTGIGPSPSGAQWQMKSDPASNPPSNMSMYVNST